MRFLAFATSLILLSITATLQYSRLTILEKGKFSLENIAQQHQSRAATLEVIRQVPTFGFDNLYADSLFLGFLQYFGDSPLRRELGYGLSFSYFRGIVERDPRFVEIYLYLSNSVSMFLGRPDDSIALMEQGLQSLTPTAPPRSYYVWRFKALDEFLFLGDSASAQQSFEKAAEWADQSSDEEAMLVAEISRQTVGFLEENPIGKAAQISAWAQVLVAARDEQTEIAATDRIEALGGTIIVNDSGQVSVNFNVNE